MVTRIASAWASEAVTGAERAIRALLSPPRCPCTTLTASNLATTWRTGGRARAIVKPYVTRRKFDFENNIGEVQAKRRCAPPSVSRMTFSTDDFLRFAG